MTGCNHLRGCDRTPIPGTGYCLRHQPDLPQMQARADALVDDAMRALAEDVANGDLTLHTQHRNAYTRGVMGGSGSGCDKQTEAHLGGAA